MWKVGRRRYNERQGTGEVGRSALAKTDVETEQKNRYYCGVKENEKHLLLEPDV